MSGNYRIDVKDFGPIGQGSIDVRPFTVLIGPSNTGKSWFATLLYAIHRSVTGDMRAGRCTRPFLVRCGSPLMQALR